MLTTTPTIHFGEKYWIKSFKKQENGQERIITLNTKEEREGMHLSLCKFVNSYWDIFNSPSNPDTFIYVTGKDSKRHWEKIFNIMRNTHPESHQVTEKERKKAEKDSAEYDELCLKFEKDAIPVEATFNNESKKGDQLPVYDVISLTEMPE